MAVEALKQRLVRLRVPLGFVLGAVVLLLASPTAMSIATGTAVALLGLVVRAWACGHLRKNEQLAKQTDLMLILATRCIWEAFCWD